MNKTNKSIKISSSGVLWQVTYGVEMNKFGMPQARLFQPKPSADLGPQLAKLMQVSLFSGPRFGYS